MAEPLPWEAKYNVGPQTGQPLTPGQAAFLQTQTPIPGTAKAATPGSSPYVPTYDTADVQGGPDTYHVTQEGNFQGPATKLPWEQQYAAPPPATRSDELLGFRRESMRPVDNLAYWMEGGLNKLGLPMTAIDHALGAPSASEVMAGHNQEVTDAAYKGVAPGKIGGAFGGIVGTAPAMALPGGPIVQGLAMGAASTDNPNDAIRTGVGAVTGAALSKAGDLLGRGVLDTFSPKISDSVQMLLDRDVPLTTGMVAGNKGVLGRMEQLGQNVPVAGELIRKRGNEALEGFNRAVANEALGPTGMRVPTVAGQTGHDLYSSAKAAMGAAYDKVGAGADVPLDGAYGAQMSGIQQSANDILGSRPDLLSRFDRTVRQEVLGRIDPNIGGLSAEGIADAKAAINKEIGKVKNPSLFEADYVDHLKAMRGALTSMLGRTSPQAAADLAAADAAYPGFKAYQTAVKNSTQNMTTPNGFFTPQQLESGINAGATNDARAAASGPLMELARAGKEILPRRYKDVISPMQSAIEAGVGAGVVGTEVLGGRHAGMALASAPVALTPLYMKGAQDALRDALVRSAASRKAIEAQIGPLERFVSPTASMLGARLAPVAMSPLLVQ